jgi:DNA uptake protein ComE-like DNA-binding protein
MKKAIKSFITFNRTERRGLIFLSALLLILIAIRATMSLWVHPAMDKKNEQKLIAAWEVFKRSQPTPKTADTTEIVKREFQDAFDENHTPLSDSIDLNTIDSATLVRLKGIGPVTAGKIVGRRKNKGPYTDFEQLKEVGVFSPANFELLKKHLFIVPRK